ncbi:Thioredoxin domain-containing protein 17 [Trichinella sp. T9]|nr:Thioredoxin domain-containing protein 17 [Trichinella sp. T9]
MCSVERTSWGYHFSESLKKELQILQCCIGTTPLQARWTAWSRRLHGPWLTPAQFIYADSFAMTYVFSEYYCVGKYATKAPSTPESVTVRQRNRINPELRYVSTCRSLRQLASQVHSSYNIYVIFCGTRNQWGYSWCPMCTALEHYVKQLAYYLPEETLLIYVEVGTLEQFQDESNCFRKDEVVKLRRVPTLMNWRTGERLVENESVDFAKLMKFMGLEKLH